MTRTVLALALFASLAGATPILIEGQAVPTNTPGLGANLYAIPGSVWFVAFEDTWDNDFNDWVGWVTFTGTSMKIEAVSATTVHNVWVSYGVNFVGQTPGSNMTVPIDATGQAVTLSFWVPTVDLFLFWYTGTGTNFDGKPHAIIQLVSSPGQTASGSTPAGDEPAPNPEPASLGIAGLGLVCLLLRRGLGRRTETHSKIKTR